MRRMNAGRLVWLGFPLTTTKVRSPSMIHNPAIGPEGAPIRRGWRTLTQGGDSFRSPTHRKGAPSDTRVSGRWEGLIRRTDLRYGLLQSCGFANVRSTGRRYHTTQQGHPLDMRPESRSNTWGERNYGFRGKAAVPPKRDLYGRSDWIASTGPVGAPPLTPSCPVTAEHSSPTTTVPTPRDPFFVNGPRAARASRRSASNSAWGAV